LDNAKCAPLPGKFRSSSHGFRNLESKSFSHSESSKMTGQHAAQQSILSMCGGGEEGNIGQDSGGGNIGEWDGEDIF
jgi:hypothetical protein